MDYPAYGFKLEACDFFKILAQAKILQYNP
jgi:hypothetical protein